MFVSGLAMFFDRAGRGTADRQGRSARKMMVGFAFFAIGTWW